VFPTAATEKVAAKDAISTAFLKEWREFLLENPYSTSQAWMKHLGADDKQPSISKEESRNIMRTLTLRAFEAPYKVMLIWLPELMHPSAANAILKILEEPSAKTLFLLVTNGAELILPTILSRTQMVKVPPFSIEELAAVLKANGADDTRATYLANLADGNLYEAMRLHGEVKDESAELFQDWMRLCFKADFTQLVEWSETFQRLGKESQKALLRYASNMVRDAMLCKYGADMLLKASEAHKSFAANFAKVMHQQNIPLLLQLFNDAQMHVERNANAKILFLNLSINIARAFRMQATIV
jgi:DNA polymerase-3 subunit delta'